MWNVRNPLYSAFCSVVRKIVILWSIIFWRASIIWEWKWSVKWSFHKECFIFNFFHSKIISLGKYFASECSIISLIIRITTHNILSLFYMNLWDVVKCSRRIMNININLYFIDYCFSFQQYNLWIWTWIFQSFNNIITLHSNILTSQII